MPQVEIYIKGLIDQDWSDWLSGLVVTPLQNKETRLSGDLPDQAALFGVLSRLNNLGLTLVSVQVEEMQNEFYRSQPAQKCSHESPAVEDRED
jgi:hypothetical protein